MTAPEPGTLAALLRDYPHDARCDQGIAGQGFECTCWKQRARALLAAHSERGEGTEAAVERVRIVAAARADERERVAAAIEAMEQRYGHWRNNSGLREAARITREGAGGGA